MGGTFFLLSIFFLITRKDRFEIFKRFIVILIFSLGGIFLILSANKYYTGDYLKFAFNLFRENEKWGIGSLRHNAWRGTWNTFYATARSLAWSAPFLFELALVSLFFKDRKKAAFLWSIFLAFTAFYFGWYTVGNFEYGSRFYLTGLVYLFSPAAYGMVSIFEFLKSKSIKIGTAQNALLITILLFTVFVIYPSQLNFINESFKNIPRIHITRQARHLREETGKKIIVFIAGTMDPRADTITRNIYPTEKQDILYLLFLEPEKNEELIQKYYPNHSPYIAYYDTGSNTFALKPLPGLSSVTPSQRALFYLYAGMNYKFILNDIKMAEMNWLKANREDPGNLASLINIANMLAEEGKTDRAVEYWEKILKMNPDFAPGYLSLGKINESRKDYQKALYYYNEFLKRDSRSRDATLLQERLIYFNRYGRFPAK